MGRGREGGRDGGREGGRVRKPVGQASKIERRQKHEGNHLVIGDRQTAREGGREERQCELTSLPSVEHPRDAPSTDVDVADVDEDTRADGLGGKTTTEETHEDTDVLVADRDEHPGAHEEILAWKEGEGRAGGRDG